MQNSLLRLPRNRPRPVTSSVVAQKISNVRVVLMLENSESAWKNVKLLLEQLQFYIFVEIVFGVRCTLMSLGFSRQSYQHSTSQEFLQFRGILCLKHDAPTDENATWATSIPPSKMVDNCYLASDASFPRRFPQIIPSYRHFGIYFIYSFYLFRHLKITMW